MISKAPTLSYNNSGNEMFFISIEDDNSMVLKKTMIDNSDNFVKIEVLKEDVYSFPFSIANNYFYTSKEEGFNAERISMDGTKRESLKN